MKIEYNIWRKLWHAIGSVAMVALYLSWVSINQLNLILVFAWTIAVFVVAVDLVRLNNSYYGNAIKKMAVFGSFMRKHEEKSFNSATYFIWGACLILTARWLGFGSDRLICSAVLVAGIADPAAASFRYRVETSPKSWYRTEPVGLGVCTVIAWVILAVAGRIDIFPALLVGLIIGMVEWLTPIGYVHYRMKIKPYVRQPSLHLLIDKFYPDDNLLIPVLVFWLGILAGRF